MNDQQIMMDAQFLMDPGLNTLLQENFSIFAPVLPLLNGLDSGFWYMTLISLIYLGYKPRVGVELACLTGLVIGLNESVKLLCHLPRPYWVSHMVTAFSTQSSFGFPSGGSMYGVAIYGFIAWVIRRWWVTLVCFVMILLVSMSRLLLGVHFLLDIIGGWVLGGCVLLLFVILLPGVEKYGEKLPTWGKVSGVITLSLLPILMTVPSYLSLAQWSLPVAWNETALIVSGASLEPVVIQFSWSGSALILGSITGYQYLGYMGGWNPSPWIGRRIIDTIIGISSTLIIIAFIGFLVSKTGLGEIYPPILIIMTIFGGSLWVTGFYPHILQKCQ